MEPGLVRLWTTVFEDSEEYVCGFADHMGGESLPIVRYADGVPVSALHLLSCDYRLCGGVLPASYIYAAATLPAYRGRGLMSRLVRRSFRKARQLGFAVSLVLPASESLYRYYGSFGFSDVFQLSGMTLRRDQLASLAETGKNGILVENPPPHEIYETRMRQFPSAAVRSNRMFSFGAAEFSVMILRDSGGMDGLCLSQPLGGQVLIKELLADDRQIPLVANSLLLQYPNTESFQFSLPMDRIPQSLTRFPWTARPYGMARLLDVGAVLGLWAKANPQACFDISVSDPILQDNGGGNFRVEDGRAVRVSQKGTLKVNVSTLTRLLLLGCDEKTDLRRSGYSRSEMETFFPIHQPYMNMMMD